MKNKVGENTGFKVGDIVKVNLNATIEDLIENHWHGCKGSTVELLENVANVLAGKTYRVMEMYR